MGVVRILVRITKFNSEFYILLNYTIMDKKIIMLLFLAIFPVYVLLNAQSSTNNVIEAILKSYSSKLFTTTPVTDSEIDLIVKCGIKAPSGRNSQPWKFTVVKDQSLAREILKDITPGNILIIVSGKLKQDGTVDSFNCGLATENMYIAAQSLGLGAHIYGSPVNSINSNLKEKLEIPTDYKAVIVIRIGNTDKSVDAVSSASTRKEREEIVIYK
jgi:nitroreductase